MILSGAFVLLVVFGFEGSISKRVHAELGSTCCARQEGRMARKSCQAVLFICLEYGGEFFKGEVDGA